MSKTEPVKSIEEIVLGGLDISKNKIINVLAKHNEYAIYEIETDDINNRLKVFIDGHTDESEAAIQKRFNLAKLKYIEAKGMLTKSSNFEMMKHRIAHTLSSCLGDEDIDGKQEFSDLIKTITREHEELVTNRVIYLSPIFVSIAVSFFACLFFMEQRTSLTPTWQILTALLGASLGGGISILNNAKTLNFEEFKTKYHYFLLGLERVLLSFVAAGVAYIAIKSGVLFPSFMGGGYWPIMLIMVVSGFSETFIPGFLSKSERLMHNKIKQQGPSAGTR